MRIFFTIVAVAVSLVAVSADIWVLTVLVRTSQLTRFQKTAQGVFVLLAPIVGPWVVLHANASTGTRSNSRTFKSCH